MGRCQMHREMTRTVGNETPVWRLSELLGQKLRNVEMQSINTTTSLRSHGLLRSYGDHQWLTAHWQRQGLLSSPGQRIPTEDYVDTPFRVQLSHVPCSQAPCYQPSHSHPVTSSVVTVKREWGSTPYGHRSSVCLVVISDLRWQIGSLTPTLGCRRAWPLGTGATLKSHKIFPNICHVKKKPAA